MSIQRAFLVLGRDKRQVEKIPRLRPTKAGIFFKFFFSNTQIIELVMVSSDEEVLSHADLLLKSYN